MGDLYVRQLPIDAHGNTPQVIAKVEELLARFVEQQTLESDNLIHSLTELRRLDEGSRRDRLSLPAVYTSGSIDRCDRQQPPWKKHLRHRPSAMVESELWRERRGWPRVENFGYAASLPSCYLEGYERNSIYVANNICIDTVSMNILIARG
jgi:hypothetical protein